MTNVLIIRLSAMGDVAMTAPIVGDLRKKYPNLKITILTAPFLRPFFRDISGVEFVELDLKGRHKGIWGMVRLFFDIRRNHKIDIVADLHDVLRTKLLRTLFYLSGKKVKVIDKGRNEKRALTRLEDKIFKQLRTTPERYADVFAKLGYEVSVPQNIERKSLPVPEPIKAAVGEKESKWIGVAPFAQHKGKIYPLEKMEKVLELLSERNDLKIFIFGGGKTEKSVAESWQERYKNTFSVIGKIKLSAEMDLIANLDAIVSMDSSAMHIASIVGTPVVSIWGATHPFAGFMGIGQSLENAVQVEFDCRPCSIYGNKPCVKGDYPCLNGIDPQSVANKVFCTMGE